MFCTPVCLGLGIVLGGVEEAKASSEMLHCKLHDLMLEWEGRSLLALEGLSNSCAAYARLEIKLYQWLLIPSSEHCQPSTASPPLLAPAPSACACSQPINSVHSTHCVPGLCRVQWGECGIKTWSWSSWSLPFSWGDRLNSKY